MKIKKNTKYYRNLVYLKVLKIPLNSIIDNKIIKFNCLNCKKEVEAFIGSSLGYTLLCKDCYFKKFEEYKEYHDKRVLFENFDEDVRKLWLSFFNEMNKIEFKRKKYF